MAEDVDVADRTKEKERENPKERQKGRKAVETKARARKVAEEKWPMASVPIVMNLDIGQRIVLTW